MSRKWTEEELQAIVKRSNARLIDRDLKAEPLKLRERLPVAEKATQKRARKAITPTEHQSQCAVVQWFDLWGPLHGLDRRLLFAIPNGSYKSVAAGGMFKAEGLRAGCPDLCLALPAPGFHSMYLEMKREGGSVSPEQAEYHALLRRRDMNVIVAYSAADAIRAITVYAESALNVRPQTAQDVERALNGRSEGSQEVQEGSQASI